MTHFFEEKGFHFVGQDIDGERMEIVELDGTFYILSIINISSTSVTRFRTLYFDTL